MTRRDDLKLSHGASAKVRENAVTQDRVRVTNAIGHHPERSGFLRRPEFIGGTGGGDGMLHVEDSVPFLAAFEDREADVLVYAGVSYVVEESQDWPRYTRAIALRET